MNDLEPRLIVIECHSCGRLEFMYEEAGQVDGNVVYPCAVCQAQVKHTQTLLPSGVLVVWEDVSQIGHSVHLLEEKFLGLPENWHECFYCKERMPHKWDVLKTDMIKYVICRGCGKRQFIQNHEESPDGTLQVAELTYE